MTTLKVGNIEHPDGGSNSVNIGGTGGVQLPVGTTAQRPANLDADDQGIVRFNSEIGQVEYWSNTSSTPAWRRIDQTPGVVADFLVVAGGGSGGRQHGAGGGAGGFRTSFGSGNINGGLAALDDSLTLSLNTNYTVTIGAGGSAQTVNGWTPGSDYGTNGGNSVFATITSTGGGAGGPYHQTASLRVGKDGGSGGGGSSTDGITSLLDNGGSGTTGQGFGGGGARGNPGSGGGGGAHAEGQDGTLSKAGNGGEGGETTIITAAMATSYSVGEVSGSTVYFAGGGGGGSFSQTRGSAGLGGGGQGGAGTSGANTGQESGAANTGGGGGGSSNTGSTAGNGGSGVVIIRIPDTHTATFSNGCTVQTDTSINGVNIYIVTATSTSSETVSFASV